MLTCKENKKGHDNGVLFLDECSWMNVTGTALLQLAMNPNFIGQPSLGIRCTIFGKCATCICPNYVKYSKDNGTTWLGYTFDGTPGEATNVEPCKIHTQ